MERNQQFIENQELKYRSMFNSVDDAIFLISEGKFVDCNTSAIKLFETDSKEAFINTSPANISPARQPNGSDSTELSLKMMMNAIENKSNRFEWIHKKTNGELFPAEVSLTRIDVKDQIFIHANVRDISQRKERENQIEESNAEIRKNHWLINGQKQLNDKMIGNLEEEELAQNIITFLSKFLDAQIGALYLADSSVKELTLWGTYAFSKSAAKAIQFGEGLVGQAALDNEQINISDVPKQYMIIDTAFGKAVPGNLIITPFTYNNKVLGVAVLGAMKQFTEMQIDFLNQTMNDVGIAMNSAVARAKTKELLNKTILQATKLQAQQEELRAANEELQEQTEELRAQEEELRATNEELLEQTEQLQAQEEELRSTNEELQEQTEELQTQEEELRATNEELQEQTEELQAQEEELRATNDELGEKTIYLEKQSEEISEQNRLINISKEELEQKAQDLIKAGKYKSEFLANMSHELRTPMNGVIGMTGLLLETKLSEEQLDFVETIKLSGDSLLTIINDILDFSKIESGKMDLEEVPFEIHSCIEDSFDLIYPKAREKKIELIYHIDPEIPHCILGDVTRVKQILVNLAGNSIKFTEKGEIFISAEKKESKDGNHIIQFGVKDTGIGIPQDRIDSLFNAFTQADSSTTRKFGGTGLGLAICSKLVELMNGKIWIESEVGEGSTFFFTLETKPAEVTEKEYFTDDIPDLRGKKVLIVDDIITNRKILRLQCEYWGLIPIIAATSEEALSIISKEEAIDLAMVDFQMPKMTGVQLGKKIKQSKNIPMIMLSSYDTPEGLDKKSDLFKAVLTKPIKKSQLFDAIIVSLTSRKKSKRIQKPVQLDSNLANKMPLRLLLAEDNKINQKLASKIFDKMGYKIDVAEDGLETLNMMDSQNYDIIFMDVQMPQMDGLEATEEIRKLYPRETGPIIVAMTANALQGDKEKCLEAGMDDFISKPIKITAIQDALIKWGGKTKKPMINSDKRG